MSDPLTSLAANTSRRGFLARVSGALVAATAAGTVAKLVKPGEADAHHFCGHTFTTGSCPHPTGTALPRIDAHGYPLGDQQGQPKLDPDGRALPPAPRTKVCQDEVKRKFGLHTSVDGSWYRCCGGRVRKLVDCCAHHNQRINGDAALEGYCFSGRKVFCVMFFQTKVPC